MRSWRDQTDDSLFALVYTLDEDDDFTDPDVWIKANPSLDVSIPKSYLAKELQQAQLRGSVLVNSRTKHMNEWVSSSATWIPDDIVMLGDTDIEPDPQQPCWGGLDLVPLATSPHSIGVATRGGYITRSWFYAEDTVENASVTGSHMYEQFKNLDNVFITEGNVTDYDAIRRFVTGYHIEDGRVQYDAESSPRDTTSNPSRSTALTHPMCVEPRIRWDVHVAIRPRVCQHVRTDKGIGTP